MRGPGRPGPGGERRLELLLLGDHLVEVGLLGATARLDHGQGRRLPGDERGLLAFGGTGLGLGRLPGDHRRRGPDLEVGDLGPDRGQPGLPVAQIGLLDGEPLQRSVLGLQRGPGQAEPLDELVGAVRLQRHRQAAQPTAADTDVGLPGDRREPGPDPVLRPPLGGQVVDRFRLLGTGIGELGGEVGVPRLGRGQGRLRRGEPDPQVGQLGLGPLQGDGGLGELLRGPLQLVAQLGDPPFQLLVPIGHRVRGCRSARDDAQGSFDQDSTGQDSTGQADADQSHRHSTQHRTPHGPSSVAARNRTDPVEAQDRGSTAPRRP